MPLNIQAPPGHLALNPIPTLAGWYTIGGRRVLRMDRHLEQMPPFGEILSVVRAQDALEGLHRDESLVTVILPDKVSLSDIAGELNAYSDANIHVTTYDDTYLHKLLVAVRN